jgi:hypothetical protein
MCLCVCTRILLHCLPLALTASPCVALLPSPGAFHWLPFYLRFTRSIITTTHHPSPIPHSKPNSPLHHHHPNIPPCSRTLVTTTSLPIRIHPPLTPSGPVGRDSRPGPTAPESNPCHPPSLVLSPGCPALSSTMSRVVPVVHHIVPSMVVDTTTLSVRSRSVLGRKMGTDVASAPGTTSFDQPTARRTTPMTP